MIAVYILDAISNQTYPMIKIPHGFAGIFAVTANIHAARQLELVLV